MNSCVVLLWCSCGGEGGGDMVKRSKVVRHAPPKK